MGTQARVVVLPQSSAVLRVEEIELPDPGPTQVVVKEFASGICHSQLHQMHRPRESPVILGHEATGIVLKTGTKVKHVTEGDTVLVTWVPRDAAEAEAPPVTASLNVSDGTAISENVFTWADHTLADQQYVVKVDPGIKKDVTSIIGCAVMTGAGAVINTAKVRPGQSVAIFGVGGVGLSAVAGARMAGANPIIAVDLAEDKLAFAKAFGATHVVNANDQDAVEAIRELTTHADELSIMKTMPAGVDFAFDCIGIRTTKIRALDRTLISIPNATFADMELVNWAQCDRMLILTQIGLRYETTPDQLRHVLANLREMLYAHPKIERSTVRVRYVGYGPSSRDVQIRVYALTQEWNEFHAIREDVFLRVDQIVAESGTSFAFPSQTLYLGRDGGLDRERSEAAKQQVADWRRRGALPFPDPAAARIDDLAGTLDYPPRGSVEERRSDAGETHESERLSESLPPNQSEADATIDKR